MRFAEIETRKGRDSSGAGSADASGSAVANESSPERAFGRGTATGCTGASAHQSASTPAGRRNPPAISTAVPAPEIMNLVREFNQQLGMTVVMVTHERALAERYAQRLIFLADGKLVSDELNSAVIANAGLNPAPERGRL